MQFYALFPLIYLAARRWSPILVAISLAGASLILAREYFQGVEGGALPRFAEPSLLAFHLAKFVVGMLIYEAGRVRRPSLLAAAFMILAAATRWYGAAGASLLAIVALLAWCWYLGSPRWASRLFGSRPVSFLSDTSYSVYLIHNMLINLVGWPVLAWVVSIGGPLRAGEAALTLAVLATAYPLASLMYRSVERKGVEWGKSVAHSRASIAAPMT